MAITQDFAKLGVIYKGNALTKITSISLELDGGQQPVDLLNQGLSGFTPGSGKCTINIGYVVPTGGSEDTFHDDCADGLIVRMQVFQGAKSYIGDGKVMNNKISQEVNANTAGTFEWMGEMKKLA